MRVVHTRVAVVQLAYHPAIVAERRSPLEDPLWRPDRPDSLLPPGDTIPEAIAPRFDALRRRIRETYGDQILSRVCEVLAAAGRLGVRIIVFPDYSLPWEILGGVADAAGEIVVVAGAHTVDRSARRSGLYERLGVEKAALPSAGQAVCPVLYRGRALALVPKLCLDPAERASLRPAEVWAPVAMPDGIAGPMGVIGGQDFLEHAGGPHRGALTQALASCRFLAMPTFVMRSEGGVPKGRAFLGRLWVEARNFGRPVLYAAASADGGTSVFVDEGRPAELRAFPDRAGFLDSGDEGVVVAGVNLDHHRMATHVDVMAARAVQPVAAASLVYRAHPVADAYAAMLLDAADLLSRDDGEALDALAARVEQSRDLLLNAGALPGAGVRQGRLSRLLGELDKITAVEDIRRFLCEIVLPGHVLPLGELRAAMAAGAADCVFAWMREVRSQGLQSVETSLRTEAQAPGAQSEWTSGGAEALARAVQAVREVPAALGPAELTDEARAPSERPASGETDIRVVLPQGIDPVTVGLRRNGGFLISFRARPEDFLHGERESHGWTVADWRRGAADAQQDPFAFDFSEIQLWAAESLYLLANAEGASRVTVAAVRPEGEAFGAMLILSFRDARWVAWEVGTNHWLSPQWGPLHQALLDTGIGDVKLESLSFADYQDRIDVLLRRFGGAEQNAHSLRARRLHEVGGHFIEPDVRIGTDPTKVPLLEALDTWLKSGDQVGLLLGEFGSGKSTGLTEWAVRRWSSAKGARPIIVNLAGAPASRDEESLLLDAAAVDDTPANRAALRLLIHRGPLVACFDGFDEMAARLDHVDVARKLAGLVELTKGGGKVVIASHASYFPADAAPSGIRRLLVQPFTEDQVEALVGKVRPDSVADALGRIAQTYELKDLVTRPLLLGMVLSTLDDLLPDAKVGTADLYETYLTRWLEQTQSGDPEGAPDTQRVEFAEALAEQLWRSGAHSVSWQEIQQSVRARLSRSLLEGSPPGNALLRMQGGAFFVRDGEDRYQFAHKSFLEYFLARSLVHTLPERPKEALSTRRITPEVAAFVGEILKRQGTPKEEIAIKATQAWLAGKTVESFGGAGAHEDAAGPIGEEHDPAHWKAVAETKANALRLLLGLARWSKDAQGWIPEGAHLRRAPLAGEDLSGARLVGAHLDEADLTKADLTDVDLSGATLDGARLCEAQLLRTVLEGATARGADFTDAGALQANLARADLSRAVLRNSTWLACHWEGARLDGADKTGFSDDLLAKLGEIDKEALTQWMQLAGKAILVASEKWRDLLGKVAVALAPAPAAATPAPAPSAPNPFRPGPALTGAESLPGREPVVAELIALIEGRSPAILRGPRRCGKTSILHLLPKRLAPSRRIIHVTLEGTRIITSDDLACILDPSLKENTAPADTLRQLLREERNAVLLLDEVANLEGADPAVFAWLRAVGQEEAAVVLAGSHWDWVRVVEHAAKAPGSSFGNDVTPVDLGPLLEADALRFLVDSAPPDVPIEEERTAKWIVELCGPWPFYLQVMGHAVVQAVRTGKRLSLVDRRGVSDLYEQRLLLDRDAVFRGRFAELPERVRRVLFASRETKPPLYRELSRDDRKILRDTGLCNPFGYWLDDRPFFDWIRRSADDPEGAH